MVKYWVKSARSHGRADVFHLNLSCQVVKKEGSYTDITPDEADNRGLRVCSVCSGKAHEGRDAGNQDIHKSLLRASPEEI